jgi:hypothetical protein
MKVKTSDHIVKSCVERRDGAFLIITTKGQSGVAVKPVPVGACIKIIEGKVEHAG